MKNREEFLYIKKCLLTIYPDAEILLEKTNGKHYLKLIVRLDGKSYKAPFSGSPSDKNWFKQAVRQMRNKIFMEY